jgi:hypothetical protein
MEEVRVYYLFKNKALSLQFNDGVTRTFSPSAMIPKRYVDNLLSKRTTLGGCCNKAVYSGPIFATEEQLNSGERKWVER